MVLLAQDYYSDDVKKRPTVNSSKELTMSDLLYGNYINEVFKDAKKRPCNASFIIVKSLGNKNFSYEACLVCDDYRTMSATCEAHGQGLIINTESVVVTHRVLTSISNSEKNAIKDQLISVYGGSNNITRDDIVLDLNSINVNQLGNYTFKYVIPKANIYMLEGTMQVIDDVAPTITGDTVYTTVGEPVDVWKYITVSDNYYSEEEIVKGFSGEIDISTPGNYPVVITAKDPSNNIETKTVTIKVIENIASFSPEQHDWTKNNISVTMNILNTGLTVSSWRYRTGLLGESITWNSYTNGSGTSKSTTLSTTGINIIEVEVTYTDGTVFREQSGQYKIDKEQPTCGGVSGGSTSWTKNNRTITVGCTDALSTCEQTSYSKTYSTTKKTDTITIKDSVGNETSCSVNVYVDKTKPTCGTVTTDPNGASNTSWVSGQRQVDLRCNDSDSLCATTTYTKVYTASQTTGEIVIKDTAENEETCTVPVYLDTDTPTRPTVTGTVASNTEGYSNTITISGGSSTSGIKGYEYCEMTSNTTSGCTWKSYTGAITYNDVGTTYFFARAVNKVNTKGIATSAYIIKIKSRYTFAFTYKNGSTGASFKVLSGSFKYADGTSVASNTVITTTSEVSTTDTNWEIAFLSTGELIPSITTNVDIFAVGGGGGGAGTSCRTNVIAGGGGGGGGYTNTVTNKSLTAISKYTVTIGAGGAGGTGNANGATGGTTSFGSLCSAAGGEGGNERIGPNPSYGGVGGNGGSGGGAGKAQGGSNENGIAHGGSNGAAGSEGGCSKSACESGSTYRPKGGTGCATNGGCKKDGNTCTNTTAFCSGSGNAYAGGGGGGVGARSDSCGKSGGNGGTTGGGAGAQTCYSNGNSGEANTGGGGGGAADCRHASDSKHKSKYNKSDWKGGNGGSGIIILRNKR